MYRTVSERLTSLQIIALEHLWNKLVTSPNQNAQNHYRFTVCLFGNEYTSHLGHLNVPTRKNIHPCDGCQRKLMRTHGRGQLLGGVSK